MAIRTEAVGLEELHQAQRHEHERHALVHGELLGARPGEQPEVRDGRPDPAHEHQENHGTAEDPHARVARRPLHQVAFGRIHSQSQRRQAVCGEVDVEDLDRAQRHRHAQHRRAGHDQHLADIRRQQIHQVLLDVAEDPAPFFNSSHDRREVVVGQRHGSGFLGDIRARDAHGNADVGLLQRGRIVNAVAGHGHDVPVLLEGAHDAQLVCGRNARKDVDRRGVPVQFGLGHRIQLGAGDHASALQDAELAGDGLRRHGVIAGDHDDPDAGPFAACHGILGLRSRRVDHAGQPEEGHPGLRGFERRAGLARHAQYPQGLVGQLAGGFHQPFARRFVQWLVVQGAVPGRQHMCTGSEDDFRRALGERDNSLRCLVQGGHPLRFRGEGDLADAREVLLKFRFGQARLGSGHNQRALRGIALDVPAALGLDPCDVGVGGERARAQELSQRLVRRGGAAVRQELAAGFVARAGYVPRAPRNAEFADRHLVFGQGPGLVRADHGCAAQRLHGRQPPHQRMAFDHALDADRQRDRDDSRQRLWHNGHGQGDAEDEHLHERLAAHEPQRHDQRHDHERDPRQHVADLVEVFLERRAFGFDRLEQPRDLAEFGVHGRGHDHGAPAPVGGGGAGEGHVLAVAHGHVRAGDRVGVFLHGDGLARERGFLDLQVHRFDEPHVGRHAVARLQQHDVAWHQV